MIPECTCDQYEDAVKLTAEQSREIIEGARQSLYPTPDHRRLHLWAQEIRACVISYPDVADEELRCATLSVSGWLEKLADEVEEAIR